MKTKTYLSGIVILATLLMLSGISFTAMEPRAAVSETRIAPSLAPGYCESEGGYSTVYEYITGVYYTKNPTGTVTITVNVYIANPYGCTYGEYCGSYDPSPEYVNVWVDWDGDKVWEAGEQVIDDALTGYMNINYRGTMTSSHVISVPADAVNNTWLRANLGWDYDPDVCDTSWTFGNVVDKEIGILTPPTVDDINVTGPPGNESYPMTTKPVTLEAIIDEAEGYEVYKISWWGDVEEVAGDIDTYNPHTYTPDGGEGKHGGNKVVGVSLFYRNTETGEIGVDVHSKLFDLFFVKYGDDNGDPDGKPNWFEYWGSDGAVLNLTDAHYLAEATGYGVYKSAEDKVYVKPKAAGQHYWRAVVVNGTFFGDESFGGPTVTGIHSVAEVVSHEFYHKWVRDQWKAGGEFVGKTDSDSRYKPAENTSDGNPREFEDLLPDDYETGTSHTTPINETDTYNLNDSKAFNYKFYGDNEYMAMRAGNDGRASAKTEKDWAHPGKQTTDTAAPAPILPALVLSKGQVPNGVFTQNSADEGNDTNANGLYDYLTFQAEISITSGGPFTALAFLEDSNGVNITYVLKDIILDEGVQNIEFNFDGITIREHGVDGPYTVSASITTDYASEGDAISSKTYTTSAYTYTEFETNAASFTGSYTDTGTDTDADGVYDYLAITVEVNVITAGTYKVEGWIYDSNGEDITYGSNSRSLVAGINSRELNFSGTAIGTNRVNGPYTLKHIKLTDSDGKQIDFVGEAHNTSAYSYSEFGGDQGGAKFGNSYNDYGSDIDMDEIYDYLTIEVGVNVSDAGNYTLTGILYNSNGSNISMTSSESALSTGSQTMLLNFDGDDIYNSAMNGPYTLKYLVLQNKNGTQADYIEEAYTTAAHNYTDFASESLVSLTGNYSDQGLDINNDTLYDYLTIEIGVDVASDGNVIISARVVDSEETEIEWANNASYLYANQSSTMTLKFNGSKIHDNLVDGPYQLKDLYVYHTGDPDKYVYVENAYNTSAYSYTDFKGSGTITTTTIVGCPGDTNSDGQVNHFDLLAMAVSYGKSTGEEGYSAGADLNSDGTVDHNDLLVLAVYYGTTC